jgi:3-deoxy-D-manno-octulosonate 8-phosphate phosphatase (KDO 8-P phosphatase)
MPIHKKTIYSLAKPVKLVIFDVDGVLTDARIYIGNDQVELKAFSTQDGLGMRLLLQTGVEIGIITAHNTSIVSSRMQALGIKHVCQGHLDKIPAYDQLLTQLNLTEKDVAYVGDDLLDLPLIRRSRLGIAVANAHDFVKKHANYITKNPGGFGAVREVCDLIMKAQNTYKSSCHAFL